MSGQRSHSKSQFRYRQGDKIGVFTGDQAWMLHASLDNPILADIIAAFTTDRPDINSVLEQHPDVEYVWFSVGTDTVQAISTGPVICQENRYYDPYVLFTLDATSPIWVGKGIGPFLPIHSGIVTMSEFEFVPGSSQINPRLVPQDEAELEKTKVGVSIARSSAQPLHEANPALQITSAQTANSTGQKTPAPEPIIDASGWDSPSAQTPEPGPIPSSEPSTPALIQSFDWTDIQGDSEEAQQFGGYTFDNSSGPILGVGTEATILANPNIIQAVSTQTPNPDVSLKAPPPALPQPPTQVPQESSAPDQTEKHTALASQPIIPHAVQPSPQAPPAFLPSMPPHYLDPDLPPNLHASVTPHAPAASHTPAAPASNGQQVYGVACPSGHWSSPHQVTCRTCGAAIPEQLPQPIARPSLGNLRLPDGRTIPLTTDVVFGRRPSLPTGAAADAWLEMIYNPDRDISLQHAMIRLDYWHVLATDLGSTNGTIVHIPGLAPIKLRPNDPLLLEPGSRIILADVYEITFEA